MMLSEKTFKSWRIDFGEKVTSSAEAMLSVDMCKLLPPWCELYK